MEIKNRTNEVAELKIEKDLSVLFNVYALFPDVGNPSIVTEIGEIIDNFLIEIKDIPELILFSRKSFIILMKKGMFDNSKRPMYKHIKVWFDPIVNDDEIKIYFNYKESA